MKAAVFFDRDGTLIEDVPYLTDPAKLRLMAGAAEAVRLLQGQGYACIVITNQSAVGRGLLSEARLTEIHAEMRRQFAAEGVRLDGLYYCTTVPVSADRHTIDDPNRKPGPGMLQQAARELGLALGESWMVGDMLSDILAGVNAGCRSILVLTGNGQSVDARHPAVAHVAADVLEAARYIVGRGRADSGAQGTAVVSHSKDGRG
jgi:histidinol-phosphate phosphatase family protein